MLMEGVLKIGAPPKRLSCWSPLRPQQGTSTKLRPCSDGSSCASALRASASAWGLSLALSLSRSLSLSLSISLSVAELNASAVSPGSLQRGPARGTASPRIRIGRQTASAAVFQPNDSVSKAQEYPGSSLHGFAPEFPFSNKVLSFRGSQEALGP